jgi:hypothetical protein
VSSRPAGRQHSYSTETTESTPPRSRSRAAAQRRAAAAFLAGHATYC